MQVQSDKIEAKYKDGVLKITLPKSEEAKKKRSRSKLNKSIAPFSPGND